VSIQSPTENGSSVSSPDYRQPTRTRRTFTESKNGFRTSEFYVMLVFVVAVLFATYADKDSLAHDDGWKFATFAVISYIVSRGLAKLATREPYETDR
jgi:hypothetical protein